MSKLPSEYFALTPSGSSTDVSIFCDFLDTDFATLSVDITNKPPADSLFLCFVVRHYSVRRRYDQNSHSECRKKLSLPAREARFAHTIARRNYTAAIDPAEELDLELSCDSVIDEFEFSDILVFGHGAEHCGCQL